MPVCCAALGPGLESVTWCGDWRRLETGVACVRFGLGLQSEGLWWDWIGLDTSVLRSVYGLVLQFESNQSDRSTQSGTT